MQIRCALVVSLAAMLAIGHALAGRSLAEPAASAPGAVLVVTNEAGQATRFTADDLQALPRAKDEVKDHAGATATYQGVAMSDVLGRAGITLGKELRGPRLATYLLVEASDGYRAIFALPELDPAVSDNLVLLADRKDGQPLSTKEGPLRILVPHEKQHSRWVRQVISMRVLSAPAPAPTASDAKSGK